MTYVRTTLDERLAARECHELDHVFVWGEKQDVCMFCKRTEGDVNGNASGESKQADGRTGIAMR